MTNVGEIPAPSRAHRLRVARVIDETADARSIVLEIPPGLASDFHYRAGQFLTLSVTVGGVVLRRCYSLSSSPDVDREHKVTVKRVPGGRVSRFLVEALRQGDTLEVERPAGRFVLHAGEGPIALYGGGSGITPLLSIAKSALSTTARPVSLFYANRDRPSIIFHDELEALALEHRERLEVEHWLDAERGFVRAADVRPGPHGAHHYLCGPEPFMAVVEAALLEAGVPPSHVHVERFVSPPDPPAPGAPERPAAAPSGAAPEVIHVEHEGTSMDVPYKPGMTLLQAAIEGGLDAPYSCREGFCGCCAALLLEGEVKMDADDALTPEAKKRGLVLACQARPTSRRCGIRFVEY